MGDVLGAGREALHVCFMLFARKLILCGELIALVAMVGWRSDQHLGVSLWPRRSAAALVAAGVTMALVLYVGFVRDFAELGPTPDFTPYALRCLGVMAVVTVFVRLWTRASLSVSGGGRLVALWGIAVVGVLSLDGLVRLSRDWLELVGHLFRSGPEAVHHGLATVLTVVVAFALVIVSGKAAAGARAFVVCLSFALLALVQGFLAFRGVSAIFILAVPAALGWRAGWRLHLDVSEAAVGLRWVRRPAV